MLLLYLQPLSTCLRPFQVAFTMSLATWIVLTNPNPITPVTTCFIMRQRPRITITTAAAPIQEGTVTLLPSLPSANQPKRST